MKRILLLLPIITVLAACNRNDSFTVNGHVKGTKEKKVYIHLLDVDTPVLIDSAVIKKNGNFSFEVKAGGPEFYQLGYSNLNFITLLAQGGEKIKLDFPSKNLFENYTITGSAGSQKVQYLDFTLTDTKKKLDSLSNVYAGLSADPANSVRKTELENQFNDLVKIQRKKNIEFIITNLNSLASIKALYQRINSNAYVLYDQKDLQYLKIVTDSLTKHYPNSRQVQALSRDFEKEMGQMYLSQINKIAKDVAPTKLDPDLKDINGKRVVLSSLKGKYVLLSFWSYQSKECVAENLQLKDFYKQYNKKGFEIYQINLDPDESAWKAAVRFDELPWISTREDDPNDLRNATLYNVKGLPTNYLYDKTGNIIGSNLHGRSLQLKLEQLFN